MKIALVSHEYPPFRGGGIGTYTDVMAAAFARAGHQVHVLTNRFDFGTTDPRHHLPVWNEGNLWVHRIEGVADGWSPRPDMVYRPDRALHLFEQWHPGLHYAEVVADYLQRLVDEHGVQVAEFPECAAEGYSAIRRKLRRLQFLDLPITVTLHSPIFEIYQYNLYSRHNVGFLRRTLMEDECIRHADAINSPSRLLGEIVKKRLDLGSDERPWDVIPLPMDFASIPRTLRGRETEAHAAEPTLLFVGRLEPRKGVKFLIDAAVRVMAEHPALRVHLVGRDCDAGEAPGMMSDFLKARIPPDLRGNFEFVGPVPREQLFQRYADATACVFAAPWDNFPLSCVEAMACGACVVASDYTGMAEMIEHDRSGLLFKSRDADSLAGAIRRAITDADLNQGIRLRAPRAIRTLCDPERAVRNRVAHYERTIESHARLASARARPITHAAARRPTVAVMIWNHTSAEGIQRSAASAAGSAAAAGIHADITVAGTRQFHQTNDAGKDVTILNSGEDGEASALRAWLAAAREHKPDYLCVLWPSEQMEERYLAATIEMLARDASLGWATTWMLPADPALPDLYAGFDFAPPLDVVHHHPVPFALIRAAAFEQVGGWDLDLPSGWREWGLWLAMHDAGLRGGVVPMWLARFVPRMDYTLRRPESREQLRVMLERIMERSPAAFSGHEGLLWLWSLVNDQPPAPAADAGQPVPPRESWDDWWGVTKTCLKRQWPGGAKAFRKYVKRQPV